MTAVHCSKIQTRKRMRRPEVQSEGDGRDIGRKRGSVWRVNPWDFRGFSSSSYQTHSLCCLQDQEMAVTSSGIDHLLCFHKVGENRDYNNNIKSNL